MSDPIEVLLRSLAQQPRHDPHDDRVRLAARLRAKNACEYCLLPTDGLFHIDHVIPPALWDAYVTGALANVPPQPGRNGPDHLDNFAWSCPFCNQRKQQQVRRRVGRRAYRLFDPRLDQWPAHFLFVHRYLHIFGLTDIGQATVEALGLNSAQPLYGPLALRHMLVLLGRYPPPWAAKWQDDFET